MDIFKNVQNEKSGNSFENYISVLRLWWKCS